MTGHGGVTGAAGCGMAPAEEFCSRTHALYADEIEFDSLNPWRDDCATLCTIAHQDGSNGGFDYCQGEPLRSHLQRQGAPRQLVSGERDPAAGLGAAGLGHAGPHSFRYQVDDIASGGSWRVSAVLFAFGA